MNLSSILKELGGVAEKIVPMIGGASGAPAALLGLAHSVQAAFSSAKALHTGPAVPTADKAVADLFTAVSAHAASTFNRAENG